MKIRADRREIQREREREICFSIKLKTKNSTAEYLFALPIARYIVQDKRILCKGTIFRSPIPFFFFPLYHTHTRATGFLENARLQGAREERTENGEEGWGGRKSRSVRVGAVTADR